MNGFKIHVSITRQWVSFLSQVRVTVRKLPVSESTLMKEWMSFGGQVSPASFHHLQIQYIVTL